MLLDHRQGEVHRGGTAITDRQGCVASHDQRNQHEGQQFPGQIIEEGDAAQGRPQVFADQNAGQRVPAEARGHGQALVPGEPEHRCRGESTDQRACRQGHGDEQAMTIEQDLFERHAGVAQLAADQRQQYVEHPFCQVFRQLEGRRPPASHQHQPDDQSGDHHPDQ